jgi:hypothetical protein
VPFLAQPFDVTFSEEEDFPEQNTDIQHIKSAKLAGLTLTLTSGESNWDFINLLRIYAEADGLERSLVASVDPAPDGVTTLTLTSAGLELAPYVKANGGFTLTSEAEGCPPSQNTTFVGEVRINVTATPL